MRKLAPPIAASSASGYDSLPSGWESLQREWLTARREQLWRVYRAAAKVASLGWTTCARALARHAPDWGIGELGHLRNIQFALQELEAAGLVRREDRAELYRIGRTRLIVTGLPTRTAAGSRSTRVAPTAAKPLRGPQSDVMARLTARWSPAVEAGELAKLPEVWAHVAARLEAHGYDGRYATKYLLECAQSAQQIQEREGVRSVLLVWRAENRILEWIARNKPRLRPLK